LLRRGQRRRRLTDGDPAQRITGAWLELTDALRLAGRVVPGHLAASEVAAHAAAAGDGGRPGSSPRPALPPVDDLAALVNTAAFGPGVADAEQAGRAGARAVAYTDGLRARQPWWRRVWWSVHPGPLRWHRRR
ncbi:MAG TPA: transglutaminase domain-containing protein, partial [Catenuloplanes sp.]